MTSAHGEFPGTAPIPIVEGAIRSFAVSRVLASPLYRGAAIALFLAGLGNSAAVPQMSRFLVDELHAPLSVAGFFYLTSLTAPIAGYLIGRRSDRTGKRLVWFRWCALFGGVGWLGIAAASQAWIPFVISALALAVSGVSLSQIFAAVHDEIVSTGDRSGDGVIAVVRMALTAGWIVGPALGALVAGLVGTRWMLVGTAILLLAQILPLGFLRDRPPVVDGHAPGTIRPPGALLPLRTLLPLLAFTALYVLVFVGDPIRYAYLPITMERDLHLSSVVIGLVIGIQPLVELLLMPFAILVSRRIGAMPLMAIGAAFGVAANVTFALSTNAVGMFVGQILVGGMWGVFAALGIIVAQRLLPGAVATASAIFLSAPAVTSALGGLSGAFGSELLGLPHVFFIPAAFGAIAAVGLAIMSRSEHHRR